MKNTLHIGNKIKKLRTEKGLKQLHLAKLLNISQSALSRMESRGSIAMHLIERVSKALRISPTAIYSDYYTYTKNHDAMIIIDTIECQINELRMVLLKNTA